MERAVVLVGLGFGDEGKGATTDFLCRHLDADLVVRYSGGSQCGHNVQLPNGKRHVFSQFGAGTLAGVKTYLGPNVIIFPEAIRRESEHLRELGVYEPLKGLLIDSRCLVSTVYHRAANRLRELYRACPHGSCGHGIGETRRYWLKYGGDAVFARDLLYINKLVEKMELLRQRLIAELEFFDGYGKRSSANIDNELDKLGITATSAAMEIFERDNHYSLKTVDSVPSCDTAIFEGAQGVLLDEWYGFHPHTTWSTVTTHHAQEIIDLAKPREVCVMGCARPYFTRHGAGPLIAESSELTRHVNDVGNPYNKWQHSFRCGWLNPSLLNLAAEMASPFRSLDCVSLSCVDHLDGISPQISEAKIKLSTARYSLEAMRRNTDEISYLGNYPEIRASSKEEILSLISQVAPIAVEGQGPTFEHRRLNGDLPWKQ